MREIETRVGEGLIIDGNIEATILEAFEDQVLIRITRSDDPAQSWEQWVTCQRVREPAELQLH